MNQLFPNPVTLDGYQVLFQGCSVSEQVRVENGNLVRILNLISVPTLGPALAFQLYYNSNSVDETQGFGYGWSHSWGTSLTPSPTEPIFRDHTGRTFTFRDDEGEWNLDLSEGIFEPVTLTSLPDDEWQISYYPDGSILRFDDTGRLLNIKDTIGNGLQLSYNGSGQILELEEDAVGVAVGRKILFAYDTDTVTITDPRNNDWVLHLDGYGNLTSVEGPEGCVTTFTYADPEDHLITGRIDPVVRDPEEMPLVDQAWSYTFDGGQLRTVTDSRGQTLEYTYLRLSIT